MEHTVFILGAGASVCAGAPLMGDFLDVARSILDSGRAGSSAVAFQQVFRAAAKLQLSQSKATLDLKNIEAVFAAFEMARLFGRLGNLEGDAEVGALPDAMRTVIVRTLNAVVQFPIEWEPIAPGEFAVRPSLKPPQPYHQLGQLIRVLGKHGHAVAVITFNYDVAVDFGITYNNQQVSYGLEGESISERTIPLDKLHGSANWAQCEKCKTIIPHQVRDIVSAALRRRREAAPIDSTVKSLPIDVSAGLSSLMHCEAACKSEPLIVPPTWNKAPHYDRIQAVWRKAAKHLHDAQNIVVIGYSWPNSDHFFHHLYALGTAGETLLRRFWLVDPSSDVRDRYLRLLGEQARQRCQWKDTTFESAIPQLMNEFKITNLDEP